MQATTIELEPPTGANSHVGKSRDSRHQRLPSGIEVHQRLAAEWLDNEYVHVPDALIHRAEADIFGPNPQLQLSLVCGELDGNEQTTRFDHPSFVSSTAAPLEHVHPGRPEETGHMDVCRTLVDLLRCADLAEATLVQHRNALAHRHRFGLVVRDVDHRCSKRSME